MRIRHKGFYKNIQRMFLNIILCCLLSLCIPKNIVCLAAIKVKVHISWELTAAQLKPSWLSVARKHHQQLNASSYNDASHCIALRWQVPLVEGNVSSLPADNIYMFSHKWSLNLIFSILRLTQIIKKINPYYMLKFCRKKCITSQSFLHVMVFFMD